MLLAGNLWHDACPQALQSRLRIAADHSACYTWHCLFLLYPLTADLSNHSTAHACVFPARTLLYRALMMSANGSTTLAICAVLCQSKPVMISGMQSWLCQSTVNIWPRSYNYELHPDTILRFFFAHGNCALIDKHLLVCTYVNDYCIIAHIAYAMF